MAKNKRQTYTPLPTGRPSLYRPVRRLSHDADTYYFAYGSNLNINQMLRRCVDAEFVAPLRLPGFRLVFRGVADIVPADSPDQCVEGAVYKISEADEFELDVYEGFRRNAPHAGLYRKEAFAARLDGEIIEIMYYTMNRGHITAPSSHYFETILQGFRDWELDTGSLYAAQEEAVAEDLKYIPQLQSIREVSMDAFWWEEESEDELIRRFEAWERNYQRSRR